MWLRIYEHFEALHENKKERILNAAFREFGRFGYKKTSAEQVAKAAGIAKGMLFHYFGSKLGLYEYLATYASDFMAGYFGNLDEELAGLDYIQQYQHMTKIKLGAYTKNPYVFEFFTTFYLHGENANVSEKVLEKYNSIMGMRDKALAGLASCENTEHFRRDMDPERIRAYITWMMDGYTQKLLVTLTGKGLADLDLDPYWAEFDEMLEELKRLFYEQEE